MLSASNRYLFFVRQSNISYLIYESDKLCTILSINICLFDVNIIMNTDMQLLENLVLADSFQSAL